MSENSKKAEWFLPLAGPMPRGYGAPTTVDFPHFESGFCGAIRERVLGPPIHRDAIAAPLSAEARAVLEAGLNLVNDSECKSDPLSSWHPMWQPIVAASRAYARSLTPPDPLAEAREALAQIRASRAPDFCGDAVDRLDAALAKLGEKP